MSEPRLYIDPDDEYQTDVLAPAVRARGPFGEDVDVIELSRPDSERARADGVELHDTPVYVFREGDEGERFEGDEIPTDPETHRMLADEHGFSNVTPRRAQMASENFDPDADVTLTFTAREADILLQMLACAADYREPHHGDPDDALSIFVEEWIEASGWEITEDYGPWSGFIEMVEDLRWRYEHQPHTWRGEADR